MDSPKDLPAPVVAAIEALDSDQRRRILIDLEDRNLSYSEILQRTGLDKGTLNYHLKKLVAAGLIRNLLIDQKVSPYSSYYEVSELARNLVEGLLGAFRPPAHQVRLTATSTYSIELTIDRGQARRREEAPDAASMSVPEAARMINASATGRTSR